MDVPNAKPDYSDVRYKIQSDAERYTWTAYFIFGLLSSFIGDTLILIATFQKDTFKINKFLVAIIQHIAVSDLANGAHFILPTIIALLEDRWIMGETLCYARVYIAYVIYPAGMSFISVLTTSKFLIMKYPTRVSNWSPRRAHQVCAFVWIFLFLNPILFLVVDKNDLAFDYRIYTCEYRFQSETSDRIMFPLLLFFISALIPNILIVATTFPTLKYLALARRSAKRVKGSVPWQGALTVGLTSIVYCISTLPFTFYKILIGIGVMKEDPENMNQVNFYRASYFLLMMNLVFNFYIYILTIRSFRRFIYSKFSSAVPVSVNLNFSSMQEP